MSDEMNRLYLMVWCPWCGALPEAKCKTATGGDKTSPHKDRRYPVDRGYEIGVAHAARNP